MSNPSSNSPTKLNSDQIHYLREVLGVDNVLVPDMRASGETSSADDGSFEQQFEVGEVGESEFRTSGDQNSAKLIVLIANEGLGFPLQGEVGDLTHKMIQAMKYPASHVYIIEWNHARSGAAPEGVRELLSVDPKPLLIFGTATAGSLIGEVPAYGQWTSWNGTRLLVTEHPNDLLAQPEKKKVAWAHLQTFMKILT